MTDRRTARTRRLGHGIAVVFVLELRRHLRSRGALLATFVAPLAISSIVVFALGSTDDLEPSTIGWVALDEGPSTRSFIAEVVRGGALDDVVVWEELASVGDAEAAVADERLGAAIVVGAGDGAELRVVADEDPLAAGVAATIVDEFSVRSHAAALAFEHGVAAPDIDTELALVAPGGRSLDAAVHWGPALGVFLVLLAMGHAAHRQVEDRRRSIVGRMAASTTPQAALSIGRALASTTIGASALLTMAVGTEVIFGRSWGPVPVVAAVIVGSALAVAGVGALIATVAGTTGQAQTLTSVVAFVLAIGGGSFTPPGASGPPTGLTRWLPTSLSLDGFSAAATTGALADASHAVLVLAFTGASLLVLTGVTSGREVTA